MERSEEIPSELTRPADAALAWLNDTRGTQYRLTGLVDTDAALAARGDEPMEFGLVLCEGDHCTREQVRVLPKGQGFEVAAVEADNPVIPPLLDPPVGVRSAWLDEALARHDFILLLFYRGRW